MRMAHIQCLCVFKVLGARAKLVCARFSCNAIIATFSLAPFFYYLFPVCPLIKTQIVPPGLAEHTAASLAKKIRAQHREHRPSSCVTLN